MKWETELLENASVETAQKIWIGQVHVTGECFNQFLHDGKLSLQRCPIQTLSLFLISFSSDCYQLVLLGTELVVSKTQLLSEDLRFGYFRSEFDSVSGVAFLLVISKLICKLLHKLLIRMHGHFRLDILNKLLNQSGVLAKLNESFVSVDLIHHKLLLDWTTSRDGAFTKLISPHFEVVFWEGFDRSFRFYAQIRVSSLLFNTSGILTIPGVLHDLHDLST